MPTNDYDLDPNEATENQVKLKRVEMAIRRRGDSDLLMLFDGIAFISDLEARRRAMIELRQKLES